MKKVKKMAFGGMSSRGPAPVPTQALTAQPGAIAKSPGQIAEYAKRIQQAGPLQQSSPRVAGPAAGTAPSSGGLLQALGTQQKFNPVSAGKLDAVAAQRAASQLTPLQRANIAYNQAQAAAAPKNFTTTGTFPSPQTVMPGYIGTGTGAGLPPPLLNGAFKKGGKVKAKAAPTKKYAKGGSVSSASKRADGCATKGKTRGRMV